MDAVLPAYQAFAESYTNREFGLRVDTRLAANAAGALKDVLEHLVHERQSRGEVTKSANELRRELALSADAYQYVTNFADCWKHRKIDRSDRLMESMDDVGECIALIRYQDSEGVYYGSRKLLRLQSVKGNFVDVGRAIRMAVDLVARFLISEGVIPSSPRVTELLPAFAKRDDTRFFGPVRLLGDAGEHFELQQLPFVYSNGTDLNQPTRERPFGDFTQTYVGEIRKSQFFD